MKRRSKKNKNTASLFLIAALVLVVVVFVFAPTGKFFATDYTIDNGDYILELTPSIASAAYTLTLHGEETFTQTIPLATISSNDYDLTPIAALDGDQDGVLDYTMKSGEPIPLDLCPDTALVNRPTHDENGNEITYFATDPLTIGNKEGVDTDGCISDDDGDGVINVFPDLCENTPAGETVNTDGCSSTQLDDDNDGVANSGDLCPNTPANENVWTDAARLGCSQAQALADSDSDKVYDSADQCPNTPEIQKQNSNGNLLVDAAGIPIMVPNSIDLAYSTTNPDTGCAPGETPVVPGAPGDEDNDGVPDSTDLCPNTPAEYVALVYNPSIHTPSRLGCIDSQLVDTDADTIYDSADNCPNTPNTDQADTWEADEDGIGDACDDSDEDTVMDAVDQCPNTPTGETVTSEGCSTSQIDEDNDGVNDMYDLCPATPAGSTVDSTGCATSQTDIDGDGILNENDICPNTPIIEIETVNSEGCSESQRDTDGDGVIDSADQCPTEDATGYDNDSDGCLDDTDQDGVKDPNDLCPNTPEGSEDIVYTSGNRNGCVDSQLIDTDGDGLWDSADQCTTTPEIQKQNSNGNLLLDTAGIPIMVPNNVFESYSTTNPDTGCAPGESTDTDLDNDGVSNTSDLCPDTPANTNIYQDAARLGCSQLQAISDEDSDGIYDSADQCAATLTGATIDAVGCSDLDQDGVVDPLDLCPGTQSDVDGNVLPVNSQGCSDDVADTDQDGVLDTLDQCPNTPIEVTVNSIGCGTAQIDTDQDGVLDPADQCPNTPTNEQADSGGCSDSQMPVAGIQLSAEVYDVNDLVSGVLSNLPKTVNKVYWFDGVKDTTYKIFDDAPNQRTLCKSSATKYCTLGSATYSTLAFGEDCSCSTFTDDIPVTFKIYNNHVTTSNNFVTVYRSANDCPAEGCSVHAYVMYIDGTTDLFETKAVLSTTATPASAPKPYGVNSQDCALGGQQILNTNWCCATGYIAEPDLTDVSLTGGDPNACKPYSNQPPIATFISSSNNISLGDTVTFDASESADSDGTIIEYLWNFGDGTTGTGTTTNHTYSTACTVTPCTVTLTVKDNFNQASTETEVIEIELLTLPADTTAEDAFEEVAADPAAEAMAQQQAALDQERQALAQQQQQMQQQQALAQQKATADASGGGMGWLIALIVLALLGVGGWFAYKRFGKKPPARSPAAPAQPAAATTAAPVQPAASPIRKFISAQKGQGLSNEQIRTKLRGKGWRDGDIDRYMNASRA